MMLTAASMIGAAVVSVLKLGALFGKLNTSIEGLSAEVSGLKVEIKDSHNTQQQHAIMLAQHADKLDQIDRKVDARASV